MEWLDDGALLSLIDTLPRRPLLAVSRLRLSLAGDQDKLPVVVNAEFEIGLPNNGMPSTHILKKAIATF